MTLSLSLSLSLSVSLSLSLAMSLHLHLSGSLGSGRCAPVLQDGAGPNPGPPGEEPAGAHLHGGGQLAPGVQMDLQRQRADALHLGVQVSPAQT